VSNAIVCPITVSLSPTAAYISLAGDNTSITVDASKLVKPIDYGSHEFTLTVASANFASMVT
jgi:hypothetical protein